MLRHFVGTTHVFRCRRLWCKTLLKPNLFEKACNLFTFLHGLHPRSPWWSKTFLVCRDQWFPWIFWDDPLGVHGASTVGTSLLHGRRRSCIPYSRELGRQTVEHTVLFLSCFSDVRCVDSGTDSIACWRLSSRVTHVSYLKNPLTFVCRSADESWLPFEWSPSQVSRPEGFSSTLAYEMSATLTAYDCGFRSP